MRLQAGADKTVRLYDVNSAREVNTFSAGTTLDDTQVGCCWLAADTIASVALNGDLLLFDQRMAACHTRVIAHQRSVTAMAAKSSADDELWTADYSGRVLRWNTGACSLLRKRGLAMTCSDDAAHCQVKGARSGCPRRIQTPWWALQLARTTCSRSALTIVRCGLALPSRALSRCRVRLNR